MSLTEMSDEDFRKVWARNRALSKIMHETRHGEVDGIGFDLRHDAIKSDEWTMDMLGGDEGTSPTRLDTLPFIWFPWHGTFDAKKLEAEIIEECKSSNTFNQSHSVNRDALVPMSDVEFDEYIKQRPKHKPIGKKWIKAEIAKRTPDAILHAGDRIEIQNIVHYLGSDIFDHFHDTDELHVFVKITDKFGIQKILKNPIVMLGTTKLTYGCGKKPIFSLMQRVLKHHKIELFDRKTVDRIISDTNIEHESAYEALFLAASINRQYLPRIQKLRKKNGWRSRAIGDMYLDGLDEACMFGYHWRCAEQELNLRPLVEAGQKSVSRARKAGKKSGESRRKEADETWKPHALDLAQLARVHNPEISTEKLVDRVGDGWRLSIKVPAHSTLTIFLANMEKVGTLVKRQRKQNP